MKHRLTGWSTAIIVHNHVYIRMCGVLLESSLESSIVLHVHALMADHFIVSDPMLLKYYHTFVEVIHVNYKLGSRQLV